MKNFIHNRLVHDFIGAAICLVMAFALFMFAACSNDHVAGGVTEETRGYALTGRVGDVYPKLLKVADSTGGPVDSLKYDNSVFANKGSIIAIYELDSLTLDTTGRFFVDTVDNDSGRFEIKEMNLKSPYVLIKEHTNPLEPVNVRGKLVYTYYNYSAIVDLRNIQNVNVSSLTSAKVPLVQKYFAEGNSYAQASKMAEREILESFGIYEDLGSFEEMPEENSELYYVNKLAPMSKDEIQYDLETIGVTLAFASPKYFLMKGAAMERYYLNSMKMVGYEIGYLARLDSLGRCTESRENEAAEVKGFLNRNPVSVVCRSGKWTVGFKMIEHIKGSMTDNRDGKTYKTVTYNFGGTSQTWMAENLDFTDTTSLSIDSSLRANLLGGVDCYRKDMNDSTCGIYGHEYLWRAAMNIGADDIKMYSVGPQQDSILVSKNCLDAYVNAYAVEPNYPEWGSVMDVADSCDALLNRGNDSVNVPTRTWTWNYTDFITPANQNSYQGICPDGWRIPTLEDWMTLLQNLGEQYGVDYGNVVPVLYDETATGFGMNSFAKILGVEVDHVIVQHFGLYNYFIMADASYYVAEFFNMWQYKSGFSLKFPDVWHVLVYKYNNPDQLTEWLQSNRAAPYEPGAVRCIKN
jgi:uncharacterized protein (TIGR02145 family)